MMMTHSTLPLIPNPYRSSLQKRLRFSESLPQNTQDLPSSLVSSTQTFSPSAPTVKLEEPSLHETSPLKALGIKTHPTLKLFHHDTPVHHYELKNGLHVFLAPDRRLPVVHVSDCVGVGSRHEQETQHGMAHFLEHLVADGEANATQKGKRLGSKKSSGGHLKAFDRLRRKGLDTNAMTSQDWTRYYTHQVPKADLEEVLKAHASRLIADAPFQAKDVERERGVISEEIRLYQDTMDKKAQWAIGKGVFKGTPYEHHPLGGQKDIKTFSPEALRTFYHQHYHPHNRALVLSGDLPSPETLMPLIHQLYDGGWEPHPHVGVAHVKKVHASLVAQAPTTKSTKGKPLTSHHQTETPLSSSGLFSTHLIGQVLSASRKVPSQQETSMLLNYDAYPQKPEIFHNPRSKSTAQALSGARVLWQPREARGVAPHTSDPKDIYQTMADHVLNGVWQPESLVRRWVYETPNKLDDLTIDFGAKHYGEMVGITAETHKPHVLLKHLEAVRTMLYRQVHQGKLPTTRSLEAAKTAIRDELATLKESPSGKHTLLEEVAHGWLEYKDGTLLPREGESLEQQYRHALTKTTPEGLHQWLKARIPKPDAWYTVALLPTPKPNALQGLMEKVNHRFGLGAKASTPKTQAPKLSEPSKPLATRFGGKLPEGTLSFEAPQGGEWLLKPDPHAPKVGMSVLLKHHQVTPWNIAENFQPYAHILTGLYQQGVHGESQAAFQQFIDEHGLSYAVNILPTHAVFHVSGLPEKVPEMTQLMQKLLLKGPIRDPQTLQQTKQN
ncbi:MAG: M16 family metallopeptidase, partial [Vampirovibrionales bacterium]